MNIVSIDSDVKFQFKSKIKQLILPRLMTINGCGSCTISSSKWELVSYEKPTLVLKKDNERLIFNGVTSTSYDRCDNRIIDFNGSVNYIQIVVEQDVFNEIADLIRNAISIAAAQQLSEFGSGFRVISNALRGGIAGGVAGGGLGASIAVEDGNSSSLNPLNSSSSSTSNQQE